MRRSLLSLLALCVVLAGGCTDSSGLLSRLGADIVVGTRGGLFTDLQDAIDTADPGAVVRIVAGTYHGPIVVSKPLTLVGAPGDEVEIRVADGGSEPAPVIEVLWTADVRLENLTLTGPGVGALLHDGSRYSLIDIRARSNGSHGVEVFAADDVELFGRFEANGGHGITVRNSRGGYIEGYAQDNGDTGIHLRNCTDFVVDSSEVSRNQGDGARVELATSIRISSNRFEQNLGWGLHINSAQGNRILANTFSGNQAGDVLFD